MKPIILYITGLLFVFAVGGCNKTKDGTDDGILSGRWMVTRIKDKGTGADLTPPTGSAGNVYLDFKDETFSGKTMRNSISNGTYNMPNDNSINFGPFTTTQVVENEWGGAFMTILSSCLLQSMRPCAPSAVDWLSSRQMRIESGMRYDVTLEKQ